MKEEGEESSKCSVSSYLFQTLWVWFRFIWLSWDDNINIETMIGRLASNTLYRGLTSGLRFGYIAPPKHSETHHLVLHS